MLSGHAVMCDRLKCAINPIMTIIWKLCASASVMAVIRQPICQSSHQSYFWLSALCYRNSKQTIVMNQECNVIKLLSNQELSVYVCVCV